MKHIPFGSINQYRTLVANITKNLPDHEIVNHETVTLHGTVKVHGTQSSVVVNPDGSQYTQSKKRVLTLLKDNFGFASWHYTKSSRFDEMADNIRTSFNYPNSTIIFYGEWAGENIQNGVGVAELDKFFYLFGVKVITENDRVFWVENYDKFSYHEDRIFDNREFGEYQIELDIFKPYLITDRLINITTGVEDECPVAKRFGVSGIGEGVVWRCKIGETFHNMKVKGDKHSSSKLKKLASVDIEKMSSINEFVDYSVTENRLNQMYTELFDSEFDRKLIGDFINNVVCDVIKEELDTLTESGLIFNDVRTAIVKRARTWILSCNQM